MSILTPEAKETVTTLRDRLKHGQNMTKILESQLDTAQQNISLLQGQVRLANETILNLKKYFHETENTINELLLPSQQSSRKFRFDSSNKDGDDGPSSKSQTNNESRSPRTPESSESKHHDERDKRENNNKSPFAQQLRQVLDVLQDEEPRRSSSTNHHADKDSNCSDCQPPMQRSSSSKSFHDGEHYQRKGGPDTEYCKSKHKINGHTSPNEEISPKPQFYRGQNESGHHHSGYSNHCMGPCCQSDSPVGSYKVIEKSSHYADSEKSSHYIEKSPPSGVHYIPVHSPDAVPKHPERHHGHHINYVPYGYHISENPHKIMHEVVSPMSPSGRRKRYMPILPNEEPPHLKYTKVKRIDGSKLTAQKVLQDFTKRRFIPYNPRYDLDLLIVPPPIPASDLMKSNSKKVPKTSSVEPTTGHPKNETSNNPRRSPVENGRAEMYPDSESISPRDRREDEDVFGDPKSNELNDEDNNNNNNNNVNPHDDNNNRNAKVPWAPKQSMFSSKSVSVLPSIKEEPRSKLEDQIIKLRNDQGYYQKTNSPYNDNNNNNNSSPKNLMIHERGGSPPMNVMVNRRTEQYCS